MARTGTQTLAKTCGPRWPRLMPVTWAAAYLGINLARFKSEPELVKLIINVAGESCVDIHDLDAWIDRSKQEQK